MDYQILMELLKNRGSHRKFLKDEIQDEEIEKIINAARLAPSGHNYQPWKFIAIKNQAVLSEMANAIEKNLKTLYSQLPEEFVQKLESYKFYLLHFQQAPVVIAVLTSELVYRPTDDISQKYKIKMPAVNHFDMELLGVGAAVNNILLAAQTLGLASCWMVEPAVYAQKEIETILNIQSPYHCISLIPIGKPVKQKQGAERKPLNEIFSIIE